LDVRFIDQNPAYRLNILVNCSIFRYPTVKFTLIKNDNIEMTPWRYLFLLMASSKNRLVNRFIPCCVLTIIKHADSLLLVGIVCSTSEVEPSIESL